MTKKRTYTEIEKKQILEEVQAIGNMAAVAKKNNIPVGTIQTWVKPKNNISGTKTTKNENKLLKKQLADMELENKILKELLKKTYQIWDIE